MLLTIPAWIIITWICWSWGMLLIGSLKRFFKDELFTFPSFSIITIIGFAAVTAIAGVLSLWMPLGQWPAFFIVIVPCFLVYFQKPGVTFFKQINNLVGGLKPGSIFMLIASVLMVLIMSTWKINHPDTLAYHAQTIHWIENYKIIPGLAHLYIRYGYQGQWFVSCALFSFRFTEINALTFINSTFLVWYLLFLIEKINQYSIEPGKKIKALLVLLLLIVSCVSYTQVRLTASSASPDFIAAVLLWLIFYLFLKKESASSPVQGTILTFLGVFTLTLKLSAAPVIFLAVLSLVQLLRLKMIRAFVVSSLLSLVFIFPFVARNVITTGWLVFPSAFPDIVNVDWKFDKARTELEKEYITAYARTHVDYVKQDIETVFSLPPQQWLVTWWHNLDMADKGILVVMALSSMAALLRVKTVMRSSPQTKTALLATVVGIAFWFIEAPDPRFGFGFIIPYTGILLYLIFARIPIDEVIPQRTVQLIMLCVSLALFCYGGYRLANFFSPRQLVSPLGIEKTTATIIQCGQQSFNKPADGESCGDLALPCMYSDSCNFLMRGDRLTDGFKGKMIQDQ